MSDIEKLARKLNGFKENCRCIFSDIIDEYDDEIECDEKTFLDGVNKFTNKYKTIKSKCLTCGKISLGKWPIEDKNL